MPRRARIALPNVPVHLIQRGNNRQPCFFADEDFRRYMDWPTDYAGKIGGRVHAKALMTNRVHFDFCRPREWPDLVDEIRRATNGNFELGSERFAAELATMIVRRVEDFGAATQINLPETGVLDLK